MRLLQGGKAYARTLMGEVHCRLVGQRDGPVMLLIHQTPWSTIPFAEIQPCFAARGVRSPAVDTPGYGMSDAPEGQPSITQYADNLLPVLDSLHIRKVVLAGHHTRSAIAAALAARDPGRTPEEHAQRLGAPQRPRSIPASAICNSRTMAPTP